MKNFLLFQNGDCLEQFRILESHSRSCNTVCPDDIDSRSYCSGSCFSTRFSATATTTVHTAGTTDRNINLTVSIVGETDTDAINIFREAGHLFERQALHVHNGHLAGCSCFPPLLFQGNIRAGNHHRRCGTLYGSGNRRTFRRC